MTVARLRELNERAKAIQAKADAEKRELTADEQRKIDAIFADFEQVEASVRRRQGTRTHRAGPTTFAAFLNTVTSQSRRSKYYLVDSFSYRVPRRHLGLIYWRLSSARLHFDRNLFAFHLVGRVRAREGRLSALVPMTAELLADRPAAQSYLCSKLKEKLRFKLDSERADRITIDARLATPRELRLLRRELKKLRQRVLMGLSP